MSTGSGFMLPRSIAGKSEVSVKRRADAMGRNERAACGRLISERLSDAVSATISFWSLLKLPPFLAQPEREHEREAFANQVGRDALWPALLLGS